MPIKAFQEEGKTRYEVYVTKSLNGRRYQRRCRNSRSLPQARAREFELLKEIMDSAEKEIKPTFGGWIERWLADAHLSRKASTVICYKLLMRKHVPLWMWESPISDITGNHIHKLVHDPSLKISPKSRENLLQYMRVIFRDAIRERLIFSNPCDGIRFKVPEPELEAWTLTEVNHFLCEAAKHNHPWLSIWVVVVFSGIRNGEAYALTWKQVDLENRRLYITQNWTSLDGYHETKSKRNRVVPMNDQLHKFLVQLKLSRGKEEYVLPHLNAWTKGDQARILREFAKVIGLRQINFHSLRASFITICLLQGIPVVKVQAMVGHESLETTMRYVRLVGADLDGATDDIGIKLPISTGDNLIALPAR